jgi:hypothetical protein
VTNENSTGQRAQQLADVTDGERFNQALVSAKLTGMRDELDALKRGLSALETTVNDVPATNRFQRLMLGWYTATVIVISLVMTGVGISAILYQVWWSK